MSDETEKKVSESGEYVNLTESELKVTVEPNQPEGLAEVEVTVTDEDGTTTKKTDEEVGNDEPKANVDENGTATEASAGGDGGDGYADGEGEEGDADADAADADKAESVKNVVELETIPDEGEDEEAVEEKKKYDREELVRKYVETVSARESLTTRNSNAQHSIADYFRKKKNEEQPSADADKASADQDHSYVKALLLLEQLHDKKEEDRDRYTKIIQEVKVLMKEKELYCECENTKAVTYQHNIASRSVYFRSGQPLLPQVLTQLEMDDKIKEREVSVARLENIKLKNKLTKLEDDLRKKEQLAEGLHLIDFEQLKIENQTYNEKIEERNEELLKLRKKITDTVQVLTHLKEKMQFIHAENVDTKHELMEIEGRVAQKRDVISRTKNARDTIRTRNNELRRQSGLLGKTDLLLDYDDSYTLHSELRHKIETLKRQHAELSLNIKGVKQKITLVKQ